jgi:hypothetical protein
MTRAIVSSFYFFLLCSTTVCAQSGALQPQHIPAKARWLMHVDLNQIESLKQFRTAYEQRVQQHPFVRSLEEGRWKVKIDFKDGLAAVTLFGSSSGRDGTVMLLVGGAR